MYFSSYFLAVFSCMLMTFYSVLFGFLSVYLYYKSCRFVAYGYQVLSIYQIIYIAVYFKLVVASVQSYSKTTTIFTHPFHVYVFCHYFLLLYLCLYPLICCCNYTWSSYFRLLTSVLALVDLLLWLFAFVSENSSISYIFLLVFLNSSS